MQKLNRVLLSNLHILLAATIGVFGVVIGGYLSNTYSSNQTIQNWKREVYSKLVSEAMYLSPNDFLLPSIVDKSACKKYWNLFIRFSYPSEKERVDSYKAMDKVIGSAILLAEPALLQSLVEFRETVGHAMQWNLKSVSQLKGLKIERDQDTLPSIAENVIPAMTVREICNEKEIQALTKRNRVQEKLLKLMREEIGLK